MTRYELTPIYDTRKSFYGKAHVIENFNKLTLISYSTEVAQVIDGVLQDMNGQPIDLKKPGWSQTTNRHIREFAKQFTR